MADFVGMESGKDLAKFAVCHLDPVRSDLVDAPYVAETPLVLECRLLHTLEIGLHTLFVGEILDVKAEESVLGENGKPDIQKVRPMLYDAAGQRLFRDRPSAGQGLRDRARPRSGRLTAGVGAIRKSMPFLVHPRATWE